MSEDNESDGGAGTAPSAKKSSIPSATVDVMVSGLPSYDKASFRVIGHRGGVRLALPRTNGIGRAYFYADGDYALVPSHPAITIFSKEQRREGRLGGVMAEVDFGKGVDAATEALGLLIEVVAAAAPPPPKGATGPKEPRAPRKVKAKPGAPTPAHVEDVETVSDDPVD